MGSVQTVTFTAGSTSETVSVFLIDDEEYEGTEDFYATLTTTETRVRIFEDEARISIIDDGMSYSTPLTTIYTYVTCHRYTFSLDVKVFFEVDTYEVSEATDSVEICLRRVGDTSRSVTIQVSSGDFFTPQAEG